VALDLNALKEEFSYAYIHAVASAAGYICQRSDRQSDNDGVDITIKKSGRGPGRTRDYLELQVKCSAKSSSKVRIGKDKIGFRLETDSYSELIKPGTIPCILVLVIVPDQFIDWVSQSEEAMIMKHCAYYEDLQNRESTLNKASINIKIPRSQIFDASSLQILVEGVR
jgi:hypothetical protein